MIVLDASSVVEWLLQSSAGRLIEERIRLGSESLHSPHLLDLEVTQVLRRLTRAGVVSEARANEALRDLIDLAVTRYPHFPFLPSIWLWRHSLSAYDAAYVSLAEQLGATLITRDSRLASAAKHRIEVEVL